MGMTRRTALIGSILTIPAISLLTLRSEAVPERTNLAAEFKNMEGRTGARLGVAAHDTGSGHRIEYRAHERFAMGSTFTLLAAAAVLARVDRNEDHLDRVITYERADLVTHSPVTGTHVDQGMTLQAICGAALTKSDNTAGNLMLEAIGGPKGLTGFARGLGDATFRLDRTEPALNEARPRDMRDTLTPAHILADLEKTVVGTALSISARDQLIEWMLASGTSDERLRAGLPQDWSFGDKTGSSDSGMANDIAVIWPPGRRPILLAVYLHDRKGTPDSRNAIHRKVANLIAMTI